MYEKQSALFHDSADIMEIKENLEKLQNIFAEALVDASENYRASFTASKGQTLTKVGNEFRDQQSSQETDFSQDFDYSDLNWATDIGIITGKDKAIFERTINNEIYRGAKPQTANGEYIIDTGKCLMFTDGDFYNPTLSRVIVFATEYESLTADAKEMIFDEAKATGKVQVSFSAVEKMFGQGFVSRYDRPNGRSYAGQNRGRKGSNRNRTTQTVRAKSLKERFAEEGLSHLLEEDAVYSSQETDLDFASDEMYIENDFELQERYINSMDADKEKTEQEDETNVRREESAEDFDRRTSTEALRKGQKGRLAYAYRPYMGTLSQRVQEAREELKKIGIPVFIYEKLETNWQGITTNHERAGSAAIPGVGAFIPFDADIDSMEIVGHEGFHFLTESEDRASYISVLVDNIDFASAEFIAYQTKYVQEKYFKEVVGTESDDFDLLTEEIYAYITGDIHNGDPKGKVHKFLRDYDAVKAAWDDLLKKQSADTLHSTQETDNVSNRELLANAFEGITKDSDEYKLIQEYKSRIKLLNEQEEKLNKLNAEIRKIRFGTTGARDTARLAQLEAEAKNTVKAINRHDKKLLSLEASEPLRKVIERERKKEAQKTKKHIKEIQQSKKTRAEQTELRHKIRKVIRDLDKVLNRGNKKRNVKEDMQNVVSTALKAADILFTDNYGTYDMLRNGIGADMSDSEESLVATCTKMLEDLDKMPTDGYENWQGRQEALAAYRKDDLDKRSESITKAPDFLNQVLLL